MTQEIVELQYIRFYRNQLFATLSCERSAGRILLPFPLSLPAHMLVWLPQGLEVPSLPLNCTKIWMVLFYYICIL